MSEPVFAGPTPPATPTRRRSRWGRWVLLAMAVGLMLFVVLALAVSSLHFAAPVHVMIDGEEVFHSFDVDSLPLPHQLMLAGGLVIALLAVLVVVPVALLFVVLGVLMLVFTMVGVPLLVASIAVALLLSPLVLVAWLIWKAVTS